MRVIFTKPFRRQYKHLPANLKHKCDERIAEFLKGGNKALLNDHKLAGEYAGCRSINITGDFRAIYYRDADVSYFIAVGTHSQLY